MNTTQGGAAQTPRTDAEAYDERDGKRTPYGNAVSVYFARTLERETQAQAKRIEELETQLGAYLVKLRTDDQFRVLNAHTDALLNRPHDQG